MLLCRQVQHRVGRMQVGVPTATVGTPFDGDLPEHAGQRSTVTGLDRRA